MPRITIIPHRKDAVQDPTTAGIGVTIPLADVTRGPFELSGVAPGIYDVYAGVPDIQGYGPAAPPGQAVQPVGFGRTTVDVTRGDRLDVTVSPHHGVDVRGKVTVDGAIPDSINNVHVTLSADDSAALLDVYQQVGRFVPTIDAKGAFVIPAVPEAHYRFEIDLISTPPPGNDASAGISTGDAAAAGPRGGGTGRGNNPESAKPGPPPPPLLPPNSYVADILQSGLSIYDSGLLITDQSVTPFEVVVRSNGGSIGGIVRETTRQMPVAGATVVLVPLAPRRGNPSLFKTATSDANGKFTMTGIFPGNYKLFAWDNIEPGEYQNAIFLGQYEEKGMAINVAPAIHLDTSVSLISIPR
jgi:hypothetical protein